MEFSLPGPTLQETTSSVGYPSEVSEYIDYLEGTPLLFERTEKSGWVCVIKGFTSDLVINKRFLLHDKNKGVKL